MIISPGVVIRLVEWFALKGMKFISIERLVETAIVLSVCNYILKVLVSTQTCLFAINLLEKL